MCGLWRRIFDKRSRLLPSTIVILECFLLATILPEINNSQLYKELQNILQLTAMCIIIVLSGVYQQVAWFGFRVIPADHYRVWQTTTVSTYVELSVGDSDVLGQITPAFIPQYLVILIGYGIR